MRLGLALAIGLLVGLERGFNERRRADGARVAGLRTFAIIGLLGGAWGQLAGPYGGPVLVGAFFSLSLLLAIAYRASAEKRGQFGLTTEIAALATFAFGALAARGFEKEAAAGAVVMTALLGFKPVLHGWLDRLGRPELEAALKFLILSVAVLPNLPDQGYGPYEALNPYSIWWMIVFIAGISFAGYASVKLLGEKAGIAATSLLGGLISSTAVTLSMARLDKRQPASLRLHAAGIVLASTVMFPRLIVEVSAVNASLLRLVAAPLGVAGAVGLLGAWLLLRGADAKAPADSPVFRNPLELGPALFFGGLLAAVGLASAALSARFGSSGVYATALTAGLMDVDAVTLTLGRQAKNGLDPAVAANGILLAAAVNTVAKTVLAAVVARPRLGLAAAAVLSCSLVTGAAALALAR
ncbi:MAG: MgtC/SapB family protein [Elusimicrobiota bacterium]|nr:MAG: MgtC/SapB family protein [Elusimicrobiota bacterium]